MATADTNSEPVPRRRFIGPKPLLAAVLIGELLTWGSLRSGLWEKTGLGWVFWTIHALLAGLIVLAPLAGWRWGRQRFRFSLKALLAATLAVGAGLGSFGVFLQRSRTQREAAARLSARGAYIGYAGNDEPGLRVLIGIEYFQDPVAMTSNVSLRDSDWKNVEQLTGLELLTLSSTATTDADLAHLRGLGRLSYLALINASVTGEGLAQLGELPRLMDLSLCRSRVTGGGLSFLAPCGLLMALNLNHTKVGDAGLKHLTALKQLRQLHLDYTLISDAGLAHLQSLPELEQLRLAGTSVTDAGLETLKSMPALRRLDVAGCQVSDEAVEQFRRERPEVVLTH